jgi:pimeloyl-ACP methyl ester carboxylesterase
MTIVSEQVQLGDQLVHYVHGGKPATDGDLPIVFVHGLSGATIWWRKNLDFLSQSNKVYALDLPGFGQSPSNGEFSVEYQLKVLADWLAAIKVRRAILVGHSLGGYLSALLTVQSPALTAGLVLVDPAIFPPDYPFWRVALGALQAAPRLPLDFIPTLVKGAWVAGPSTILQVVRVLLSRPIGSRLPSISAETLILWGNKDTVVPPALGAAVRAAISGPVQGPVELRGGHVSMWDDPGVFNDAVKTFAARIQLATASGTGISQAAPPPPSPPPPSPPPSP